MITIKKLHETEMDLVRFCDDIDIDRREMRKIIIDKFTNLMSELRDLDFLDDYEDKLCNCEQNQYKKNEDNMSYHNDYCLFEQLKDKIRGIK